MNTHLKAFRSVILALVCFFSGLCAYGQTNYATWTNSSSTHYVTIRVDDQYYSAYSSGGWRWGTSSGSNQELSPGQSVSYISSAYGWYPVDPYSGNYTTDGSTNYIMYRYQTVNTVSSRPVTPPKSVVRTEDSNSYSDSWGGSSSSDSWGGTTSSDSWGSTTSSDSWGSTSSSDSWNSPSYTTSWGSTSSSDSWGSTTSSDSWGGYDYSAWSYNWSYGTWSPANSSYWEDQNFTQSRTNSYTRTRTYGRTGTRTFTQTGTRTYTQSGTRNYTQTGTRTFTQGGTRTFTQSGTRTYTQSGTRTTTQSGTRNWTTTRTTYWSDGSTTSAVVNTWTEGISRVTGTTAISRPGSPATAPISQSWTQPISQTWTQPLSSSWTESTSRSAGSDPISQTWTQAINDGGYTESDSGSESESRQATGTRPLNWTPFDRATGSVTWGGWGPDVSTQPQGTTFTQTRSGTEPWQRGESNDRGDTRNVVNYTKNVSDSRTATGTMVMNAAVTVVVNGSGSVSGGGTYPIGATATLVPSAAATSYFAGFSGDLIGGGATEANPTPTGSLVVNAPKSVVATFSPKLPQVITLGNPGGMLMTNPPFNLTWSNSSGRVPTFSVISGPAVVDGAGRVTLLGTIGTVTVRASHPGSVLYLAATPVDVSFEIGAPPSSVIMDAVGASTTVTGKVSGKKASPPRMNTNPISDSTRSREIIRQRTGTNGGSSSGSGTNTGN